MDEFLRKKPAHGVREIPIAPILDLMVVIIFFLILSTSFVSYTKLTLPASQTSVVSDSTPSTPLAPKFLAAKVNQEVILALKWGGETPGQRTEKISDYRTLGDNQVQDIVNKMVADFMKLHPDEKSIQLGLAANLNYQNLITIMDGIRKTIQDVVLVSSEEAESIIQGTTQ